MLGGTARLESNIIFEDGWGYPTCLLLFTSVLPLIFAFLLPQMDSSSLHHHRLSLSEGHLFIFKCWLMISPFNVASQPHQGLISRE